MDSIFSSWVSAGSYMSHTHSLYLSWSSWAAIERLRDCAHWSVALAYQSKIASSRPFPAAYAVFCNLFCVWGLSDNWSLTSLVGIEVRGVKLIGGLEMIIGFKS